MEPADHITVGAYEAHCVRDTPFRLDGGAMFGMVPRALWERKVEADERHCIHLALNCLLLRGGGRTILYEAGIGDKLNEKLQQIYGVDPEQRLLDSLAAVGVAPADVDTVVASHLHLDHTGWFTVRGADGEIVPTFPNARTIVQRSEWEAACHPTEFTAGSYAPENFLPLEAAGQLELVDGDTEVAPGVTACGTGAHCPGHQVLHVESEGRVLAALSDLLPTRWHLRLAWMMSYDVEPMAVLDHKRRLFRQACDEGWALFLSHDPEMPFIRLTRKDEKEYDWTAV